MGVALRFSFPFLQPGVPACADAPRALVGTWLGRLGGQPLTLDLRADGTFSVGEMEGGWSAGSELLLDDEPLRWRLDGGALLLTDPAGQTMRWVRQSAAAEAARAPAASES
jgi:hypothetical protein